MLCRQSEQPWRYLMIQDKEHKEAFFRCPPLAQTVTLHHGPAQEVRLAETLSVKNLMTIRL